MTCLSRPHGAGQVQSRPSLARGLVTALFAIMTLRATAFAPQQPDRRQGQAAVVSSTMAAFCWVT
jgi:hypothetical protein